MLSLLSFDTSIVELGLEFVINEFLLIGLLGLASF